MLIAMAGLPASGKSSIARNLEVVLNAVLLDKDEIRAQLFSDYVDYSREQNDLCMNVMYDIAGYHFKSDETRHVILDGRTHLQNYQIEAVKHTARCAGVPLCIIECICSLETARTRLYKDKDTHIAKDRDFQLYKRSCAEADPIGEAKLVVNTDNFDHAQCAQLALEYIRNQARC